MKKHIVSYLSFFALCMGVFFSCEKYHDPAPKPDPALTNPYCNDPKAVNYNWGFPGVPNNTICYYPADLFKGNYTYVDSVYQQSTGLFIFADSLTLTFNKLTDTTMSVFGLCPAWDSLNLNAVGYVCTIATLVSDTLSGTAGEIMCRTQDTVSGTLTDDLIDTTVHINLTVVSDTGVTLHIGRARKI